LFMTPSPVRLDSVLAAALAPHLKAGLLALGTDRATARPSPMYHPILAHEAPKGPGGRWTLIDELSAGSARVLVLKNSAGVSLDPRDREILRHVAAGRSNKWIALELVLAESTVSRAVRRLQDVLGARSRYDLALRGARAGSPS